MPFSPSSLTTLLLILGLPTLAGENLSSVSPRVGKILDQYCYTCHDQETQKGDVRLDQLATLPLDARLDLMNRMQEQIYLEQMPPRKKKEQPTPAERDELVAWLSQDLRIHNAAKFEDKLRYPAYGNVVNHEKLFSGQIKDAAYTPARRWLVSPQIFEQRVLDIFGLEGRDRKARLQGIANPFLLPDASGIRYFDNGSLDGGSLLVMLANAEWISQRQLWPARVKSGEVKANDFPDPKDRWAPRYAQPAFETIALKKSTPTDAEISAAIKTQFSNVLRRQPTAVELQKYTQLTRSAMSVGGNTEGLRQMLVAVLLESEFLYRLEFGAGEMDSFGRKMLAPIEGAYAISYALGDRGPDAKLLQAAEQGRLRTREDYRREVMRLLDDNEYYRGHIDPALAASVNGKSHESSHPRIMRFFREFFGYPNAVKIFKDVERTGGVYQNPGRGTFGTPGYLVDEADRVVDHVLQKDKNVFANLLTTEDFFVYHNKDSATARQIIADWRKLWDGLKDTQWRTEPDRVMEENAAVIRSAKLTKNPKDKLAKREFLRLMYYLSDYFGKGRTPFTTVSTAHGNHYYYSPIYNLPPTPPRDRYGAVENPRFKGLDDTEFWDYPIDQPFKIANRKGILTHPAWLVAHSQNTQNDPVTRGRWVREKLLAGRVPDIPITVDAVIPEDHQKTLRDRLENVTQAPECIKCHQYMNPLGLTFEIYDDFGRYRTNEPLEHIENLLKKASNDNSANLYKTLPVNSRGFLEGTGDSALDGEVGNSLEMIDRLAKSKRVRQSFIRYAFRFYMGRNEMLSDSKTLIDADNAYVQSGGSFRAVIVSLLTSDSFIYRKNS